MIKKQGESCSERPTTNKYWKKHRRQSVNVGRGKEDNKCWKRHRRKRINKERGNGDQRMNKGRGIEDNE